MTWFILLSLVIFGAMLILVEVLFVPGTTVVGLIGIVFTALGIYYAFLSFDNSTAFTILGAAVVVNLSFILYGFRSGAWEKFALKDTISSRTYDDRLMGLEQGQKGKTLSDCKPFGKVEIGDKIYEAKSEGGFIPAGTDVYILKIENNKIIIKQ